MFARAMNRAVSRVLGSLGLVLGLFIASQSLGLGWGGTAAAQTSGRRPCACDSCSDGQRDSSGCCPLDACHQTRVHCGDHARADRRGQCACVQGFESFGGACVAICVAPETRQASGICSCPEGSEAYHGRCVSRCATGQIRSASGACGCPEGTELFGGACLRECAPGLVRDISGTCVCRGGAELTPGGCRESCRADQTRAPGTFECTCRRGQHEEANRCVDNCPSDRVESSSGVCVCRSEYVERDSICVAREDDARIRREEADRRAREQQLAIEREEREQRLATEREERATQRAEREREQAAARRHRRRRALIFTGAGVGAVGIGTGIGMISWATIQKNNLAPGFDDQQYVNVQHAGWGVLGAGALVGGGLLIGGLLIDDEPPNDVATIQFRVLGNGLELRGTF